MEIIERDAKQANMYLTFIESFIDQTEMSGMCMYVCVCVYMYEHIQMYFGCDVGGDSFFF